MSRRALLPVLALACWALVCAAPARGAPGWRLPVSGGRGAVVAGFVFERAHAYARGWRRGVDLRATPGAVVRAPCTGRVSFAGVVPGRDGRGVSVRCGGLVATVLGLTRPAVRRGGVVLRGARLGVAGAGGRVRLGARRRGDRHGYVDPLGLLGGTERAPPPPAVAPPAGRWVARTPHSTRLRQAGRRAPAPPPRTPSVAWLGATLVGVALGAGVTRRRVARRVVSAKPCPSTSPRRSTT